MKKVEEFEKKNLKFAGIWFLVLLFAISYSYKHLQKRNKFWASQTKNLSGNRSPAQMEDYLSKIDIKSFHDYFIYETFQKYLEFELSLKIRTDKSKEYYKKKTKLAIHYALAQTFKELSTSTGNKQFTTILKENIISSFIKHFVKTLRVFQIVDGTFQIDFDFTPQVEKKLNFNTQLKSNQLISYSHNGDLSKYLNEDEKRFDEKVLDFEIPPSTKTYQYKGGQISIWLKILDTEFDLGHPIPNPKKNAVKGYVRFRKYYKANNLNAVFPNSLKDENFNIKEVHFKQMNDIEDSMVTVDQYKKFNLQNLIPTNDYLEIHFGKHKADNFYREGFLGRLFTKKYKDTETSELMLNGVAFSKRKDKKLSVTLKKLVYDYKTETFTKRSRLTVKVGGNINKKGMTSHQLKSHVKASLIKTYPILLIKELQLDDLIDFTKTASQEDEDE